jgi:hypothetical protein
LPKSKQRELPPNKKQKDSAESKQSKIDRQKLKNKGVRKNGNADDRNERPRHAPPKRESVVG